MLPKHQPKTLPPELLPLSEEELLKGGRTVPVKLKSGVPFNFLVREVPPLDYSAYMVSIGSKNLLAEIALYVNRKPGDLHELTPKDAIRLRRIGRAANPDFFTEVQADLAPAMAEALEGMSGRIEEMMGELNTALHDSLSSLPDSDTPATGPKISEATEPGA